VSIKFGNIVNKLLKIPHGILRLQWLVLLPHGKIAELN
jgi:hypothetical protein